MAICRVAKKKVTPQRNIVYPPCFTLGAELICADKLGALMLVKNEH
jgi:hypothetical protein